MKVKLTKEEFIKRSMDGEVFEFDSYKYFYDENEKNPFRFEELCMNESWGDFNGKNEFTVVEPKNKTKTKIVKEWMYLDSLGVWHLLDSLLTDKKAKKYFGELRYKPTGREFEVLKNNYGYL